MTPGEVITAYQEAKNLTDSDLARLWGVSPSFVHYIKKGERKPGNKVWNGCRSRTPELEDALREACEDKGEG